jgi:tRNA-Thr(GGU) m(6)t(6)A37 methyltransferase TsaA
MAKWPLSPFVAPIHLCPTESEKPMEVTFRPIGVVKTDVENVPRHWTVSDVEGTLVMDNGYLEGLRDIRKGDKIVVIFHFHKSPRFSPQFLIQTPPHRNARMGVFSICSPIRPNPIGMSVLDVLDTQGNVLKVRGLDMLDGTPILDIKPHVERPPK